MRYSDLTAVQTTDAIFSRMKTAAKARGADPDSWQSTDVISVVLWVVAYLLASLYALQRYFALGAVFSPSTDPDLAEVWSKSQFMTEFVAATSAEFNIELINDSENIYELEAGFCIRTSSERRYLLVAQTLCEPGAALYAVKAEVPGVAGNVAPESINILETPLSGVYTGENSVQTASGTDRETVADLYARCQLILEGLGAGQSGFVGNLARMVDDDLTKIKTRVNSAASGEMTIYAGMDSATATISQCNALAALIASLEIFQAIDVSVVPADIEIISISGIVTCFPGQTAKAQADVEEAVAKWQRLVTYGGTIRKSDYWRLPLGFFSGTEVEISGIFSSSAIDSVDFTPDDVYNVDQWRMVVFELDLTFQ